MLYKSLVPFSNFVNCEVPYRGISSQPLSMFQYVFAESELILRTRNKFVEIVSVLEHGLVITHVRNSELKKQLFRAPANISTWDQRCFNVLDQHWNKVDLTLKIKQYPTADFQRCTTWLQRQYSTLKQCRNKVVQRCINVASA